MYISFFWIILFSNSLSSFFTPARLPASLRITRSLTHLDVFPSLHLWVFLPAYSSNFSFLPRETFHSRAWNFSPRLTRFQTRFHFHLLPLVSLHLGSLLPELVFTPTHLRACFSSWLTLSRTCFHTHSLPLVKLFIPGHSFTNLFSYSLLLVRLFTPTHSFSNLFSPSLITAFAIFTPAHFLLKLVFIPTHTPVWDFSHRFTLSLFFTPIHPRVPLFTPSFSVSNSFSSLLTYACAIFTPAHSLSNLFSSPLTFATPFSLPPRTCFHSH